MLTELRLPGTLYHYPDSKTYTAVCILGLSSNVCHNGYSYTLFQWGRSILQSIQANNFPQTIPDEFMSGIFFQKNQIPLQLVNLG